MIIVCYNETKDLASTFTHTNSTPSSDKIEKLIMIMNSKFGD